METLPSINLKAPCIPSASRVASPQSRPQMPPHVTPPAPLPHTVLQPSASITTLPCALPTTLASRLRLRVPFLFLTLASSQRVLRPCPLPPTTSGSVDPTALPSVLLMKLLVLPGFPQPVLRGVSDTHIFTSSTVCFLPDGRPPHPDPGAFRALPVPLLASSFPPQTKGSFQVSPRNPLLGKLSSTNKHHQIRPRQRNWQAVTRPGLR